jgi:hypothetical protein
MRKVSLIFMLVGLSLLVVMGSGIACKKEAKEEVLSPQMAIIEVSKEATLDPSDPNDLANKGVALEMALEISNPNDFEISISSLMIDLSVDGTTVEHPNITERFYVPGKTTVFVRRVFVYQPMSVIGTLMAYGGKTFPDAMAITLGIWDKVINETAEYDAACSAAISSEFGDLTETYQLSWVMPTT